MRLTVKERKKAAAIVAPRYQKARKKEKGLILDEFTLDEFTYLTGYGRRYASYVLRSHGKKIWINPETVLVSDVRKPEVESHVTHFAGNSSLLFSFS